MKWRSVAMNKTEMKRQAQLKRERVDNLCYHQEFMVGLTKVYASFTYEREGQKYAEFIPPLSKELSKKFKEQYKEYK